MQNGNERAGLARRKKDLERQLGDLAGASRQIELLQVESFADPIDQVVSNADREIAGQRLESEGRWIRDIEAALDKIRSGSYGECESCEEPIGGRRLDAIPWARLCVSCQSALEQQGNEHAVMFDQAA
ncbi:MAG TPA: TraR/DksA family transcriptional regulator [Bryobacteraceae bacterium]|jgi:DnaK suppressor protein